MLYEESENQMFNATIAAGQNALKVSFLINGGASVALLTFLGQIISTKPIIAATIAINLIYFGVGLLCTAVASGVAYITQWHYQYGKISVGNVFNITAIICVFLSYCLYAYGLYNIYHAFVLTR